MAEFDDIATQTALATTGTGTPIRKTVERAGKRLLTRAAEKQRTDGRGWVYSFFLERGWVFGVRECGCGSWLRAMAMGVATDVASIVVVATDAATDEVVTASGGKRSWQWAVTCTYRGIGSWRRVRPSVVHSLGVRVVQSF